MSNTVLLITLWLIGIGVIVAVVLFAARQKRRLVDAMIQAVKERGPINVVVNGAVPTRTRSAIAEETADAIVKAVQRGC